MIEVAYSFAACYPWVVDNASLAWYSGHHFEAYHPYSWVASFADKDRSLVASNVVDSPCPEDIQHPIG